MDDDSSAALKQDVSLDKQRKVDSKYKSKV